MSKKYIYIYNPYINKRIGVSNDLGKESFELLKKICSQYVKFNIKDNLYKINNYLLDELSRSITFEIKRLLNSRDQEVKEKENLALLHEGDQYYKCNILGKDYALNRHGVDNMIIYLVVLIDLINEIKDKGLNELWIYLGNDRKGYL